MNLIASRFQVLSERVHQTDVSFMVNMLLTEGETPLKDMSERNYEYSTNRIRRRRSPSSNIRGLASKYKIKSIDIKELESVKLLSSPYPAEMDLVNRIFSMDRILK